ncbi:NnrU family protein [Amaricoccus macauensis]|uniref:NnrU family protein n=1 Tax=Amaricoccus macauensis TaxID=57001 RepID=UPI003C7CDE93
MFWLVIGLALWCGFHIMKRVAPAAHAAIEAKAGEKGARGIIAAGIGIGLLLIIIGYRASPFIGLYTPPLWTTHLNNLLMLLSVGLFGASHSTGKIGSMLRHPQLLAVSTWAVAHLLVNGDLASLLLFGVMLAWAIASIRLINAQDGAWERPAPGPVKKDIILVVITLVVYGVIAMIHTWLGYSPFPG